MSGIDRESARGTGRRHACGVMLVALGMIAAASAVALASEQRDGRRAVTLWTDEAPLRAVLGHLLGADGTEVRFGDEVTGLVDGRLEGTLDDVLGTLARDHELVFYREAEAIWVDRADRLVVRFVALEPTALEQASELFAALPSSGDGNTVALSGRGVVVAGDRPFVQKSLARMEELRVDGGVGGAAPLPLTAAVGDAESASEAVIAPSTDVVTAGEAGGAADLAADREAGEAGTAAVATAAAATPTPAAAAIRSVSDIPGFDVDYADRATYAPYMQETGR